MRGKNIKNRLVCQIWKLHEYHPFGNSFSTVFQGKDFYAAVFHIFNTEVWKITEDRKLFSKDWGKIRNRLVKRAIFV